MTKNAILRSGRLPEINIPLFKDENTPQSEKFISMDCMAFGGSCNHLRVKVECPNLSEARYLFDQLAILSPILLCLSAATPFINGKISDLDSKWTLMKRSFDDRTSSEELSAQQSHTPMGARYTKSRYDSISMFISNMTSMVPSYNDTRHLPVNSDVYNRLIDCGIDVTLAQYMANLLNRDPLVVLHSQIHSTKQSNSNSNSNTNTNHNRHKNGMNNNNNSNNNNNNYNHMNENQNSNNENESVTTISNYKRDDTNEDNEIENNNNSEDHSSQHYRDPGSQTHMEMNARMKSLDTGVDGVSGGGGGGNGGGGGGGWEDSLSPTPRPINTPTTSIGNNSYNNESNKYKMWEIENEHISCFISQSWQNVKLIPPKYNVDIHKMNAKMQSMANEIENENGDKDFELPKEGPRDGVEHNNNDNDDENNNNNNNDNDRKNRNEKNNENSNNKNNNNKNNNSKNNNEMDEVKTDKQKEKDKGCGLHDGWSIEFNVMETQITDFENAAFVVFAILLARIIMDKKLNFYMPISKLDANFRRAEQRNAVLASKFYWRQYYSIDSRDVYGMYSIKDILCGNRQLKGLIELVRDYLKYDLKCNMDTFKQLNKYLNFISNRASGGILTTAQWLRQFVANHPDYNQDSTLNEVICRDILNVTYNIAHGKYFAPMLLGRSQDFSPQDLNVGMDITLLQPILPNETPAARHRRRISTLAQQRASISVATRRRKSQRLANINMANGIVDEDYEQQLIVASNGSMTPMGTPMSANGVGVGVGSMYKWTFTTSC